MHDYVPGGNVQVLHTDQPDRTLRELVASVPSAVDISVTETSLDSAYLAVIDDDTKSFAEPKRGTR